MKRIFLPLFLALLFLSSCESEQEKKDRELAQKIDDNIELSGNQFGEFKVILKGSLIDTIITVEGNESFDVKYDNKTGQIDGKMASADGAIAVEFGFKGTDLGYRSVNNKENYARIDFDVAGHSLSDTPIDKAKVAVRRAQPGNFAVGSYTGLVNLDGKSHTLRIEFETALEAIPEES
ncbi:hypothetical protein [Halocola ammonii]